MGATDPATVPGSRGRWRHCILSRPAPHRTIIPRIPSNVNSTPTPPSRDSAAEPRPAISVVGVGKRFPGVVALGDITLAVAPGETRAIVGENGAGKSTLIKILAGVITSYEGRLLLDGREVRFESTRDAEQAGVGIVHQELNLVEELSASANIFLGREPTKGWGWLDRRHMDEEADRLLAELECRFDPRRPVGELRVGDQQLVEIAKALSRDNRVLIMDEPTSALTESEVARLYRVIEKLRARGVTVLYISHKLDEVFRLADRITVLRDGRLVETLDRSKTSPREIAHRMVGREIAPSHEQGIRQPGEIAIAARGLSLPWRGHARAWRLENISFEARRGEILGFAGLMGAGRTELLECLYGASPEPPKGEISLDGRPVRFASPADALALGVALVTEDRKRLGIFEELDVGRNITLCALRDFARLGLLSNSAERKASREIVERLRVKTAGIGAAITSLSGGNQQKAILGRALLTRPKVLLLDDPTRGVDVGAKAELYRLMFELRDQGLAILVTSGELPELLTLCDRLIVLHEGKFAGEFSRAEATEQKIMEAATGHARRQAS